jgi:hypothetical protein
LTLGCHPELAWSQLAADPWSACAGAAALAETEAGLPAGLLLAIGKVESGRVDPTTGRLAPWPFAVNVSGRGMLAPNRDAAIAEVRAAQAVGQGLADVGCFQVNLLHHPRAFDSLEAGFDPVRNARYAAGFLASLRVGAGSWEVAAGRYHSMTPELAEPYAARVMAAWSGLGTGPVPLGGRLVQAAGMWFGMRVYVPGGGQAAAAPIAAAGLLMVRPVAAEVRIGGRRGRLPVVYRPGGVG